MFNRLFCTLGAIYSALIFNHVNWYLISAVAFINKNKIPQIFFPKNVNKPTNFCAELWLRACKRMLTKCKSCLRQPGNAHFRLETV
jgi:hypothetical protein